MAQTYVPLLAGLTPHLVVRGASDAIEFYSRAFGAEELSRMPAEDGKRLLHAQIRINGSDLMLMDDFPEYGTSLGEGPSGLVLHLNVDDADAWWNRAVEAGGTVVMPLADQFWGDRYGQVRDPFGHTWSIGAPTQP